MSFGPPTTTRVTTTTLPHFYRSGWACWVHPVADKHGHLKFIAKRPDGVAAVNVTIAATEVGRFDPAEHWRSRYVPVLGPRTATPNDTAADIVGRVVTP
jgi:hypothetical protein